MLCGCQQQGVCAYLGLCTVRKAKQTAFQQGSVIRKLPGNFGVLSLRNLMLEMGYCSHSQQPVPLI